MLRVISHTPIEVDKLALQHRLAGFRVLSEARDWQPCSDHVPVMVELTLD